MLEKYPDVIDITDLCKILRISRRLAYRLMKEGRIPYRKLGREYRISKKALMNYLEGNDDEGFGNTGSQCMPATCYNVPDGMPVSTKKGGF